MIRLTLVIVLLLSLQSCTVIFDIFGSNSEPECVRYSIYRVRLIGDDQLLWEETSCDADKTEINANYAENKEHYESLYGTTVYTEEVSY